MKVLVVGGAGYIGSHMVKMLHNAGREVVVLDNLSTGFSAAVQRTTLVEGDFGNRATLDSLFRAHRFSAVMHFASFSQVAESMRDPARYYINNVSNTAILLEAMYQHNIKRFIFSSTAAVYGEPSYSPIDETHPTEPINPYGRGKRMVEQMLQDFGNAYDMRHVSLRYFNAAGADPEGELGERHDPETHLIPLILQVASGRRAELKVFGRDYTTPDGTCVRDYIHVNDLCHAHLLSLDYLLSGGKSETFNLGNGQGFSVQEVIASVERVTGRRIAVNDCSRRAGDPARLVADAERAFQVLGWTPRYGELDEIVRHAWHWEQRMARICDRPLDCVA